MWSTKVQFCYVILCTKSWLTAALKSNFKVREAIWVYRVWERFSKDTPRLAPGPWWLRCSWRGCPGRPNCQAKTHGSLRKRRLGQGRSTSTKQGSQDVLLEAKLVTGRQCQSKDCESHSQRTEGLWVRGNHGSHLVYQFEFVDKRHRTAKNMTCPRPHSWQAVRPLASPSALFLQQGRE